MTTNETPAIAPIAKVRGEPWATCPKDLYIPADALEVVVDAFEGPLDLLLYLIKRQNIDILDIPIVTITTQYMQYVELMHTLSLELAAEYLAMAALLAEIKSQMLLPRATPVEKEQPDPRANLAWQLKEYELFKYAAECLDALPRLDRNYFLARAALPNLRFTRPPPPVVLQEILDAMHVVLERAALFHHHRVEKEPLSIQDRMASILRLLSTNRFTPFTSLFLIQEGRMGVVVTFMAILELLKSGRIELIQNAEHNTPHVRALIIA